MRTAQVRRDVMGWLQSDAEILALLGVEGYGEAYGVDYSGTLDDAPGTIVPVAAARDDGSSPQLAVGVSLESTSRSNTRDEETYQIRVITSGTFGWIKQSPGDGEDPRLDQLEQLRDRVVTVLTTQRSGWLDPRVTADEEVLPNEGTNRYLGVTEVTAERTATHPTYA